MSEDADSVLVVGGGIAGIQAALDLAKAGVKVVLVEKSPTIGGKMAVLDKNFPTLDCSICIEAPKMGEVMRSPNIEVISLAELLEVNGSAGDFTVKILQKPRFVTSECTRCGDCVPVCPVVLHNEFDFGMGARKAIYTPIPQSEPGAYVIDIEHCLNKPPNYLPCNRCMEVCGPKCIDFNMKPKVIEKKVKAIIVATGFEIFDPSVITEYSYGRHPDILTSIEFERLINSSGPGGGHITKPSDGMEPESVLFVLCVGSRDRRYCAYCSRICCMLTIKEALQTVEHGIKHVSVLYMDIRAYGKGFDSFYQRAKSEGVEFIRGKPGRIIPGKDGLRVIYEDTERGELVQRKYDMVVLATAALPSRDNKKLAEILGIELDEYGFFKTIPGYPVSTGKPGVYVCGCTSGPKDIPDSVQEGGAAAAEAMTFVKKRRWPKEEIPEQKEVSVEPRVLVNICHCGSNIAGVADIKELVEFARNIPGVVYADNTMYSCAGYGLKKIAQQMKEHNANRLVIAACSPKTHLVTFQKSAMMAGINPYMVEMANIRNHCTWVHRDYPKEATEKCKDMILMAVEKAKRLKPLMPVTYPVTKRVLVVGGGIAGMSAATNLARQGIETYLIERENELGGMLRFVSEIAPEGVDSKKILEMKRTELEQSGAHIMTGVDVQMVTGFVGNFNVVLSNGKTLDVGAIVMCTGAVPYQPKEFGYGSNGKVVTSLELESMMNNNLDANNITFVSCIGSRTPDKGCSRYCCQSMLKQAIRLAEMGKNVTVVYKDIRAFNKNGEELYEKASKLGVQFFQYPQDALPESVIRFDNGLVVVKDELQGGEVAIPADLLVLNVGLSPNTTIKNIIEQLKLPRDMEGFLLESHPKLGPVDTSVEGVYIAGTAQGPKGVEESVAQALAAASKASALVSAGSITLEPFTARIEQEKCIYCLRCAEVCPFHAIRGELRKSTELVQAMCHGCGTCVAECMRDAMNQYGFEDEQILAQVDAATEVEPEKKAIVFACNWCSYAGADQAGIEKLQYPPNVRIIRTMCSGRVSQKFVMRAFERGIAAVIVTGCWPQDCHYNYANLNTEKRMERWKKMLQARGIDPNRLQLHWNSAAEGKRFANKMKEVAEFIKSLPIDEIRSTPQKLKGVKAAA
ncbi:MAG: hydrogenase iron-sulfur subunit [Nitrososphaerota archaeon]